MTSRPNKPSRSNQDIDIWLTEMLKALENPSAKRATRPSAPSVPSLTQQPWLLVRGKHSFSSNENTGKWCIFRPTALVDDAWARIKTVVTAGELVSAKVSRARDGKHVICVYTKDWSDESELMAARETLRKLGFTEPIAYKRDIETLRGVYGTPDEWYRWS